MLALLNSLTGQFVFLTYSSYIIEKSGTHLPSEIASICMALVQLIATAVAYILIDRKGRKFLLIMSMFGCMLGHGIVAGYLHLHLTGFDTSMFHWTPIIFICVVIFMAAVGIGPLIFICIAELYPPKTRTAGLTFGSVSANLFIFLASKVFPILMEVFGLEKCLMICSIGCGVGSVLIFFLIQETKGKELNVVQAADK